MDEDRSRLAGGVTRRAFLGATLAGGAAMLAGQWAPGLQAAPAAGRIFGEGAPWFDATIPALQRMMAAGALTSRELTQGYLARIQDLNPILHAVIETNPQAVSIATRLDAERRAGRVRGPLHGIPVLVKDNIATGDTMQTTAGSLALVNCRVAADAPLVAQLRAAGAVVLGKANLSEWANWRGWDSYNGWSARGGFTRNPYVLSADPLGSSSGSAVGVVANLCAAAVGSETDGSINAPSSANSAFGLKPTLPLVSGRGIIPIARAQDTAGPIARSVTDAAILLGALRQGGGDYTAALDRGGLRGRRIGIDRKLFTPDWWWWLGPTQPDFGPLMTNALDAMEALGAVLVDVELNFDWMGAFPGATGWAEGWPAEFIVLACEFRTQIAEYLATLQHCEAKTLSDLIAFNTSHCWQEMKYFGQGIFEFSEATQGTADPNYLPALEFDTTSSRAAIDDTLAAAGVEALISPTMSWLYSVAAVAGYPSFSLPVGYLPDAGGAPTGFCMIGGAFQEEKLLSFAYDLEQELGAQRPPQYLGTAPTEPVADYCTGKPKMHGGTGKINWRTRFLI